MIEGLKGIPYGMIWLDIEENRSTGCGWGEAFD